MFSKDATLHSVNEVQYTMNLKLKRAAYRPIVRIFINAI